MPTITFAHRGGQAHAPANSVEAFRLAIEMGARGLETDAWLTADGVAVLDHDGRVRTGVRRPRIAALERASIPAEIMSIGELFAVAGTAAISIDLKDPRTLEPILAASRQVGGDRADRVWLCHSDWEWLASKRAEAGRAHLVHSTAMKDMRGGPERHAARLAEAGIDAVNLHCSEWSGGMTTLFHRFGRFVFGWGARHERELAELARMGIDAVYSDHVDRMTSIFGPA